ncbi:hypothetical protein ACFRCI_17125 [Streptomyces sp. NPDC056638]|uniref:hypothetical protein n=1 Tax=Streptomyces sp. NPDC056638 TaxID=3345887 RepID=UPI0036B278D4
MTTTTAFDPSLITDEMVMKTLKEVVAEKPEYVYSVPEYQKNLGGVDCFYVHLDEDGTPVSPGCVVGAVLHRLGVPLEVLRQEEGQPARTAVRRIGLSLSFGTRATLNGIQGKQDDGTPWGQAYAMITGETI